VVASGVCVVEVSAVMVRSSDQLVEVHSSICAARSLMSLDERTGEASCLFPPVNTDPRQTSICVAAMVPQNPDFGNGPHRSPRHSAETHPTC
jgi:hypothetical protein